MARSLKHLKSLGAVFNEEERASFMAVWRYTCFLMGIPETILYRDEAEAAKLYEIGGVCEPPPDLESIVMANSLINSAPMVLGTDDPAGRRQMAKYVFGISRALIGNTLADQLMFPLRSTFGVLPWFRLQERYHRILGKLFPRRGRDGNFTRFTSLLEEASTFDEAGISYRMPDHVYAEESTKW